MSGSPDSGGGSPGAPSKTARASTMASSPGKGLGRGAARTARTPKRARKTMVKTFMVLGSLGKGMSSVKSAWEVEVMLEKGELYVEREKGRLL